MGRAQTDQRKHYRSDGKKWLFSSRPLTFRNQAVSRTILVREEVSPQTPRELETATGRCSSLIYVAEKSHRAACIAWVPRVISTRIDLGGRDIRPFWGKSCDGGWNYLFQSCCSRFWCNCLHRSRHFAWSPTPPSDPLYMASICSEMASSADAQTAPAKPRHDHGDCCAFCAAGHGGATAVEPPPLVFVTLQRQYQRVSWLEAADPMPTTRVGSNSQARAPPQAA